MGKKECSIASISTCPHTFFLNFHHNLSHSGTWQGKKQNKITKILSFLHKAFLGKQYYKFLMVFLALILTQTTSIRKTPSTSNATLPQVCSMTQGRLTGQRHPSLSLISHLLISIFLI